MASWSAEIDRIASQIADDTEWFWWAPGNAYRDSNGRVVIDMHSDDGQTVTISSREDWEAQVNPQTSKPVGREIYHGHIQTRDGKPWRAVVEAGSACVGEVIDGHRITGLGEAWTVTGEQHATLGMHPSWTRAQYAYLS